MVELTKTLWEAVRLQATNRPEKWAYRIVDGELNELEAITFGDLHNKVLSRAVQLQKLGLAGHRLFLFQPTGLDFILSFFAVMATGGAVVPLNSRMLLRPSEGLEAIIADARPAALLCDRITADRAAAGQRGISARIEVLDGVDEHHADQLGLEEVEPETIAVIQYTSGSTSAPKGACITHGNFVANANLLTRTFHADSDDLAVSWLPFYHDMGLMTGVVWPIVSGAGSVLMRPAVFAGRPASWLEAISTYRGVVSSGPNFAFKKCADDLTEEEVARLDLSTWKIAICGAEPVRADTVRSFTRRFASAGFDEKCLFPSYGLAEATLFVSGGHGSAPPRILEVDAFSLDRNGLVVSNSIPGAGRQLVSCGETGDELDVLIVDPERSTRLQEGVTGEIWIRGPSVSPGYFALDAVNKDVFGAVEQGAADGRPYLRTGDLGFLKDRELFVTGRLKDLIIVRGTKYAPHDLELTASKAHPGLTDGAGVAVVEDLGEEESVIIVHELSRAYADDYSEVMSAIRGDIARLHGLSIHDVVLIAPRTLPRTSSGKVRRQPTRQAWLAGELKVLTTWRDIQRQKDLAAPFENEKI